MTGGFVTSEKCWPSLVSLGRVLGMATIICCAVLPAFSPVEAASADHAHVDPAAKVLDVSVRMAEAEPAKKPADAGHKKGKEDDEQALPEASAAPQLGPADQYCSNVQSAAAAATFAQQKKSLAQAQQEIDKRIKVLTERTDEFQKWLKKRDDFMNLASDSLMKIYSAMKPESASAQLVAMNELVAAAIVFKLPAKSAGAILAEMDASRAARLSAVIASAGSIGERKPAQEGGKP